MFRFEKGMVYMYKFEKVSNEEYLNATEGIMYGGDWVYETGKAGDEEYALFYGRCQTLFGEPNCKSKDWESMYDYHIKATADDGSVLYLVIYHGPGCSSTAIPVENHGIDTAPYEAARAELLKLINSAEPADYVWESIYADIPVNITYTVKNGRAYVESSFDGDDFDEDMM